MSHHQRQLEIAAEAATVAASMQANVKAPVLGEDINRRHLQNEIGFWQGKYEAAVAATDFAEAAICKHAVERRERELSALKTVQHFERLKIAA